MTSWRGRTSCGRFAVRVSEAALASLDDLCGRARDHETGGILIGRYSEDLGLALVEEATPPPLDSRRGRSWFVRGARGLRELLQAKWQAKQPTYYVGEWHFHPAAHVEPSGQDFRQMVDISRGAAYSCREPLLLILGQSLQARRRPLRAFVCPMTEGALELLPLGDASESDPKTTKST